MNALGLIYGVIFWVATIAIITGIAYKVRLYWKTPVPLKIPTMPAPRTQTGVVFRMFREVVFFQSLFRSDKLLWVFAILFHYGLALVLIRHSRYFMEGSVLMLLQPFGKYAAFAMTVGLVALLARRFMIDRVRYISAPSDFLMLVLLLVIGVSGAMMTFVSHVDVVAVNSFFVSLKTFNFSGWALPAEPLMLLHLTAVALLMIIFPISKLMHAPGVFFSPTRNQVDDSREKRHIAPWAAELDKQGVDYLHELKK
ncbi:MAG TPA: nitrate reductase [Thiotrichaceae bacterium]|nr:nitrate reductase [Thiotrichaceae bacterium]